MVDLKKLKNIEKPARYTGGEARQILKNNTLVTNRICLAVPDIYEMGMFDFDLKSLYDVLNNRKDTWCERAFSPMADFELILRETSEKLYTLESKTPLRNMDLLIFILSNEMTYTNMLNMLNLGGIPILKDRRKEGFPIIIATGSAVINPKPIEEFVDMFIIGDPAIVINEIIDRYKGYKEKVCTTKEEILSSMKDITGIYIPGINGIDEEIYMAKEIDIDNEIVPRNVVIPSIATIIDKAVISLSKGCDKNCIMCTHKYAYGKPQYVDVNKAVIKTKKTINSTGYTDVMLVSNCYADYPGFPEVIYKINELDRPKVKNISFMDVKLNKDNLWILKYLENKDQYPSIIIGGGTKELREKIGIDISDEDALYIAKQVFENGFNKIGLKYILGIPGETYEDFPKMLELANKMCKVYKEVYSKSPDKYIVELNVYNFSAKPHTPSQWCAVNTAENLEIKARYLKEKNKNENVIINIAEAKQTVIETMLARGDEKVGRVIYEAWKQGARFDMISPLFNFDSWQVALNTTGIESKKYLEELNHKLLLPWDFINLGTSKEGLRREYLNRIRSTK